MTRLLQILATFVLLFSTSAEGANLPGLRFLPADNEPLKMKLDFSNPSAIPGGVAFSGVAAPMEQQELKSLRYDSSQLDGARVRVTIEHAGGRTQEVATNIYDWELVPLVAFVNDADHDCLVNYQGQNRFFGTIKFQYHPSVENELLGMRLWQADFMLFSMHTPAGRKSTALDGARVDLPTDENTMEYILGGGEGAPNVAANRQRLNRVRQVMDKLGVDVPTYVICDKGQSVVFGVHAGKFSISGRPIWWFRSIGKKGEVVPHDELSRKVTLAVSQDAGVNPAVYDALVTTMRYSALFRHVKNSKPDVWESFAKSVQVNAVGVREKAPVIILVTPELAESE